VIPDRIFLVGFMGAGKTAVGRVLADGLNRLFIETDRLVETSARASITEVFEKEGENGFRQRERRALVSAATGPPAVVSTGGGLFADRGNRRTMALAGVAVWIDAPFEECFEHCKDEIGTRPLFRDEESLQALYDARREAYAEADIVVESLDRAPELIADEIVQRLEDAIWTSDGL
jgi:shikimate kinase